MDFFYVKIFVGSEKMEYRKMREYTHEEFVNLILGVNENQLMELSAKKGGYPVLYRMSLDERICHIPFIQPGSAIIIRNEKGEILLQERTDRNEWGLPGGCQDLGENLRDTAVREAYEETGIKLDSNKLIIIDTVSGASRRNTYPNGDIVYNNTSLYLADVKSEDLKNLKGDSETKKLRFFNFSNYPSNVPYNLMDVDLINAYLSYIKNR
jgi:8-oxo-dGTP pyrophosphatase MutT (NUDIX family)